MEDELQRLEASARASAAYRRAGELLDARERLEHQMREIDHEIEALGATAQLARIDRLRKALAASGKTFVLAG